MHQRAILDHCKRFLKYISLLQFFFVVKLVAVELEEKVLLSLCERF